MPYSTIDRRAPSACCWLAGSMMNFFDATDLATGLTPGCLVTFQLSPCAVGRVAPRQWLVPWPGVFYRRPKPGKCSTWR